MNQQQMSRTLLQLTNQARYAAGLLELQLHPKLQQAAQDHAKAMAYGGYFDHVDNCGQAVGERLLALGYNYRWSGENISAGKNLVEEVFNWWMSSAGHRSNILKAEFSVMGLGYCYIEQDKLSFHYYWVHTFASPL